MGLINFVTQSIAESGGWANSRRFAFVKRSICGGPDAFEERYAGGDRCAKFGDETVPQPDVSCRPGRAALTEEFPVRGAQTQQTNSEQDHGVVDR